MSNFWTGFEKAADVSKAELREELKKHEERETPEQEAAESKHEQDIERRAGVEKEAGYGLAAGVGALAGGVGNVLRGSGPNNERGGVFHRAVTGAAMGAGAGLAGHAIAGKMMSRGAPRAAMPGAGMPRALPAPGVRPPLPGPPAVAQATIHQGALPTNMKKVGGSNLFSIKQREPAMVMRVQQYLRRLVGRGGRKRIGKK